MHWNGRRKQRAVTLIEVLIVVAIASSELRRLPFDVQ